MGLMSRGLHFSSHTAGVPLEEITVVEKFFAGASRKFCSILPVDQIFGNWNMMSSAISQNNFAHIRLGVQFLGPLSFRNQFVQILFSARNILCFLQDSCLLICPPTTFHGRFLRHHISWTISACPLFTNSASPHFMDDFCENGLTIFVAQQIYSPTTNSQHRRSRHHSDHYSGIAFKTSPPTLLLVYHLMGDE